MYVFAVRVAVEPQKIKSNMAPPMSHMTTSVGVILSLQRFSMRISHPFYNIGINDGLVKSRHSGENRSPLYL